MSKNEAAAGTLQIQHDASITFRYIAPRGHTLDDCRRPDYWRNNVRDVGKARYAGENPWNRIEVIAEDGSWEAEFRVVSVSGTLVTTRVLRSWQAETKSVKKLDVPKGFKVEFLSGMGWRVLDPHLTIVAEKVTTEDEAVRMAVDNHRLSRMGGE